MSHIREFGHRLLDHLVRWHPEAELSGSGAEPGVPRRIVQKLRAHLQARGASAFESAIDDREAPDSRVNTQEAGERRWARFARCAAREWIGRRQQVT